MPYALCALVFGCVWCTSYSSRAVHWCASHSLVHETARLAVWCTDPVDDRHGGMRVIYSCQVFFERSTTPRVVQRVLNTLYHAGRTFVCLQTDC